MPLVCGRPDNALIRLARGKGARVTTTAEASGGRHMLSLKDLIGMCGLEEAEVLAIAEHEHLTAPAAAALGCHLLNTEGGPALIREFIEDDIRFALEGGSFAHAQELRETLAGFVAQHPESLSR
jgi:hypothetical protein